MTGAACCIHADGTTWSCEAWWWDVARDSQTSSNLVSGTRARQMLSHATLVILPEARNAVCRSCPWMAILETA